MGDLTGVRIADKYELVRLIGRGGMGAVYEARNVATLKRCAVKVLLTPELSGDAEVVKRFFREARASGLIESEHVVAAFDSGIDSAERAYYVMECLQGEDLEQTLRRASPLDPDVAAKITLQAATGLASAHALGIVHRDVKPANLFLAQGPEGTVKVKILDFGVAKVKMELFNESSNSLTHAGSLLGTPLYMSPEQLRRASAIDESADVWSLGVVLFECLTGQSPWGKVDGIGELVTAILTAEVPHVQDWAPWVGPELADVVHRTLSRDSERRLKSAAELRDALRRIVSSTPLLQDDIATPAEQTRSSRAPRLSLPDTVMIGPTPPSGLPVVTTTAPAPPRSRFRPFAIAVMVGALAGAGAWTLASGYAKSAKPLEVELVPPVAAASEASQPSATELPAIKTFGLEVAPSAVAVTVDGKAKPSTNGHVTLSGEVGSVLTVKLSYAGQSIEQRVAITTQGLVPSRVAISKPSAVSGPPADRPGASKTGARPIDVVSPFDATRSSNRLDAAASPPGSSPSDATPASSASIGLSEKFE